MPRSSLGHHLHGRQKATKRRPVNKKLSDVEEEALVQYCLRLDKIGTQARSNGLRSYANDILARRHVIQAEDINEALPLQPLPQVSYMWPWRFLERYSDRLSTETQHTIEAARAAAEEPLKIERFFEAYKLELYKYNNLPADTWNMDEIGIMLGQGKSKMVIVATGTKGQKRKRVSFPSQTSRAYTTMVEGISATGNVIPPFIIYAGKDLMVIWYEVDLP